MFTRVSGLAISVAIGLTVLCSSPRQAEAGQYCERTNYSAQDITDAVRNSPLRDDLKGTACSLGGLGRFESGGNKGNYNGSCCTGIFQLNNANVQKYAGHRSRRLRLHVAARPGRCLGETDQ